MLIRVLWWRYVPLQRWLTPKNCATLFWSLDHHEFCYVSHYFSWHNCWSFPPPDPRRPVEHQVSMTSRCLFKSFDEDFRRSILTGLFKIRYPWHHHAPSTHLVRYVPLQRWFTPKYYVTLFWPLDHHKFCYVSNPFSWHNCWSFPPLDPRRPVQNQVSMTSRCSFKSFYRDMFPPNDDWLRRIMW